MGNCCQKTVLEEGKLNMLLEEQKADLANAEELEVKFDEMAKKFEYSLPEVKVSPLRNKCINRKSPRSLDNLNTTKILICHILFLRKRTRVRRERLTQDFGNDE